MTGAFADVHRGRQPRTRRVRKVYAADRHALCCLGCGSNGSSTCSFENYLSYSALAGTDDEAGAGGFNDRS